MEKKIGNMKAETVVDLLRSEIRAGAIKPGEFLRQNVIAARLGVSSTPVREALAVLEREGMVRREPHRGVIVFEPTVRDLLNCYEIREALEVLAARKACTRLTKEDLETLSALASQMSVTRDLDKYLRMNQSFHELIERAAGCDRLFELISSQRAAATTYLTFLGLAPSIASETIDEHLMIVEALATGIPNIAGNAMSHHLRTRAETLSLRLDRVKASGAE